MQGVEFQGERGGHVSVRDSGKLRDSNDDLATRQQHGRNRPSNAMLVQLLLIFGAPFLGGPVAKIANREGRGIGGAEGSDSRHGDMQIRAVHADSDSRSQY